MGSAAEKLEQAVLNLSPAEREHLALVAWESLEGETAFDQVSGSDPEGIALAIERDAEITSGKVKPLSHSEFLRLTGGTAE